jgi:hypothetical protein
MSVVLIRRIKLLSVILIFATIVITLFTFASGKVEDGESTNPSESAKAVNQEVISPVLPESISFAGEKTPLELFYVKEGLDRELLINTYWHSSSIMLLKKANRWFPMIEPILKENNIPDDFKYLALIESGLSTVKSPAGAAGFWQFMEKTAREYGLEVNTFIDERYNEEKSTRAACEYFVDSYEDYQNWTLVAAAYNAGKRRISESLEQQQANNYYDLYLNEETSRYIYRILAMKIIYENPDKYGFVLSDDALYQPIPTKEIKVTATIEDLVAFAKENNISYKLLKQFNPWLRSSKLPDASGRTYYVKIPVLD